MEFIKTEIIAGNYGARLHRSAVSAWELQAIPEDCRFAKSRADSGRFAVHDLEEERI
jgi:hypothetical protein